MGLNMTGEIPKANVKETYSGTNGASTDACEDGYLVQYACETETVLDHTDLSSSVFGTGVVIRRTVDCGGRCADGACPNVCPTHGDALRYLSVEANGDATLESLVSGWIYACDIDPLGYCVTTPRPGDIVNVLATEIPGLSTGDECAEEVPLHVVGGAEQNCLYERCVPTTP